jgi:hypothetical protein
MTKSNNEWQSKGVEVMCNGRMVATTFGGDLYKHCTDFDAQQAIDHAKLIAAAPELYAELNRLDPSNAALLKARGEL